MLPLKLQQCDKVKAKQNTLLNIFTKDKYINDIGVIKRKNNNKYKEATDLSICVCTFHKCNSSERHYPVKWDPFVLMTNPLNWRNHLRHCHAN